MKIRKVVLTAVTLFLATPFATQAFAQDYSKLDIPLMYSFFRFNPSISQAHSRSLNGGGAGVEWNLNHVFAIKAEFTGYGSTHFVTTVTAPVTVTNPCVGCAHSIPAATYDSEGNMFTYLIGPMYKHQFGHITPFGELLFGGSNTNFYSNLTTSINSKTRVFSAAPTQHPFTMAVGGGLDIPVGIHIAIRPIEIDYVLTDYTNPITGTNNQNHFRYLGGVTFRAF